MATYKNLTGAIRRWACIAIGLAAIIGVAILVALWQHQKSETKSGHNGLVFDSTVVDCGRVVRGIATPFTFHFRNASTSVIEIVGTTAGCTCTEVKVSPRHIAPEKNGVVQGTIHFGKRGENIQENIAVMTSDNRIYELRLRGQVIDAFTVDPEKLDFGSVYWDDPAECAADITTTAGQMCDDSVEIVPGHSSAKKIEAHLSCQERGRWRIQITLKTPLEEDVLQRILFKTSNQSQPQIEIPVLAKVIPPITVEPRRLFLGNIRTKVKLRETIVLRTKPGSEIKDVRVSASLLNVVTIQRRQISGNVVELEVELGTSETEGLVEDQLVIEAASPKANIHIPIVVLVSHE